MLPSCILLVLVVLLVVSVLSQDSTGFSPTSLAPTGLAPTRTNVSCAEKVFVVIGNTSNSESMVVQVERTHSTSYITEIRGCHVPYICSRDPGSCNSVKVGQDYFAVPGNNTVVFVKSTNQYFELPLSECDPTRLFYYNTILWVVCKKITGSIQLSQYHITDNSRSRIFSMLIESPLNGNDPYPIFVRDHECHLDSSVFVLVDNEVLSNIHAQFSTYGQELENCTRVNLVSYFGGESFTVYCAEGLAATFDICNGRWTYHYQNEKGRFYPCGHNVGVLYGNGHIHVIGHSQQVLQTVEHSVGDIIRGQCSENLFFVVSTSGDVYATSLNVSKTVRLSFITKMCHGPACDLRFLDQNSLVILKEGGIFLLSTVEGCQTLAYEKRGTSISDGILLPFPFSADSGNFDSCQCLPHNVTHPATTEGTTELMEKTEITRQSNQLSVPVKVSVGVVCGFVFSVIVAIGVIIAIVLALRAHKTKCSSPQSSQASLNSTAMVVTTEPHPVQESAGRPGNSSVNCGNNLPLHATQIPSSDIQKMQILGEELGNDRTQKTLDMIALHN